VLWACNHTARHSTAERGAAEPARMRLDAGADPDIRDGQPQVAERPRQRGATP
jgi:hypothetical protein